MFLISPRRPLGILRQQLTCRTMCHVRHQCSSCPGRESLHRTIFSSQVHARDNHNLTGCIVYECCEDGVAIQKLAALAVRIPFERELLIVPFAPVLTDYWIILVCEHLGERLV